MTRGAASEGLFRNLLRAARDRVGSMSLASRFTAGYILLGVVWINLEHSLIPGENYVLKDSVFVLSSAVPIYWFVRQGVLKIKRVEEALRESGERMALILETTSSGIFVVDRTGTITYVNRATEAILGLPYDRIVGRKYNDPEVPATTLEGAPFPPDQRPFARVMTTGKAVSDVEFAIRLPDGAKRILSINASPLRDKSGDLAGIVASATDITERMRAQDLRLRRLSQAVEQSPVAVVIADRGGRIEYVNPAFTRMTGMSPAEAADMKSVCPEKTAPEACRAIRRALGEGSGWSGEIRNRRKTGEIYWESVSVSPIRDAEGRIANFLWLGQDITAHKQAEDALRESEERFRLMFEQNEEPIILFRSGTAEILDANPAAQALYGFSRGELAAGGPFLFVEPGDRSEFARTLAGITNGDAVSIDRTTHVRKDGRRIVVSVRGKSMRIQDRRVSYCTFRDITERIRVEEEARARQAQLIHASRIASLGTLVSGVAHEINNPNNLVMFNAPIVRNAWRDAVPVLDRRREDEGDYVLGGLSYSEMRDALPRLLDGIEDASRRIKAIVENLKEFGSQDRSSLDCPVDVNAFTRIAVSILQPEISRRTRNFEVVYGDSLPMVRGCAQQLEQVVLNLVMNALQAVPDPSRRVRVVTARDDESRRVEIRVEDDGVGIPPESIRRMGEPFFTTKTEAGGLGLGLSICRSIVEAHRGEMTFRSEVGKGTTVVVALPVDPGPGAEASLPPRARREP